MSPEIVAWATFWKWLLVGGSAAFVVLLVYTLFHGAVDIVRLLRALTQAADEGRQEETH